MDVEELKFGGVSQIFGPSMSKMPFFGHSSTSIDFGYPRPEYDCYFGPDGPIAPPHGPMLRLGFRNVVRPWNGHVADLTRQVGKNGRKKSQEVDDRFAGMKPAFSYQGIRVLALTSTNTYGIQRSEVCIDRSSGMRSIIVSLDALTLHLSYQNKAARAQARPRERSTHNS